MSWSDNVMGKLYWSSQWEAPLVHIPIESLSLDVSLMFHSPPGSGSDRTIPKHSYSALKPPTESNSETVQNTGAGHVIYCQGKNLAPEFCEMSRNMKSITQTMKYTLHASIKLSPVNGEGCQRAWREAYLINGIRAILPYGKCNQLKGKWWPAYLCWQQIIRT